MTVDLNAQSLLIYTDLDGSLLDHHDYGFEPAIRLLDELASADIPVMFSSSKTAAEIMALREVTGNRSAFICENGAAIYIPDDHEICKTEGLERNGSYFVKSFSQGRDHWLELIDSLRDDFGESFVTFEQAGVNGIMAMTGLDMDGAERASDRAFSEPVDWQGSRDDRADFISRLLEKGATVLQGGRFLCVTGSCDKGAAMSWLTEQYQHTFHARSFTSLAIGDSENDVAMLKAADIALVIRSPVNPAPDVSDVTRCYFSDATGPEGWDEGVRRILAELSA